MSRLSQLAETLIGSEIVRLGNEINARISKGEKIYNYTIGDFDPDIFPIPDKLEALIIKAYQDKYTNYPPGDGLPELRQAVASYLNIFFDLDYANNEVLIASGGRPLIYSLFRTVVNPGDKVIYAVPSWNNNHYVHMNGGVHCMIDALPENNFMPTAANIAPHIKGASLLCLCTPQNPTGTTLQKQELEAICDLVLQENMQRAADDKKLYVMFDQMYSTLTYGDTRHYNPVSLRPQMKDYTVFIDGISKSFAATGVRVGWSMGPANIMTKMKALLSHIGAWAPMAEQKATAQYLLQTADVKAYFLHFKAELEERLWRIYNGFKALQQKGFAVDAITPQAAIYLTIKLDLVGKHSDEKLLATQADVTDYILSKAKLAVVPFYAFGADAESPWYRLSIGTCKKEELNQMFAQLENALQELK
jgi:aspartate aminotransferase